MPAADAPTPPDPSQLTLRLASSTLTPRGYRQTYALAGPPGGTLLQLVETDVAFGPPDDPLVTYRGHYAEYFRLSDAGEALDDLHEFDLQRDGWDQARIRDAVRRVSGGRVRFTQAPQVRMRKRFVLSLGAVRGVKAALQAPSGAAFGFVAEGPRGVTGADLLYALPGGERRVEPAQAVAAGHAAQGSCWFTAASGWSLVERYRYDFATGSHTFDDGGGYALGPLDPTEGGRTP